MAAFNLSRRPGSARSSLRRRFSTSNTMLDLKPKCRIPWRRPPPSSLYRRGGYRFFIRRRAPSGIYRAPFRALVNKIARGMSKDVTLERLAVSELLESSEMMITSVFKAAGTTCEALNRKIVDVRDVRQVLRLLRRHFVYIPKPQPKPKVQESYIYY